VEGALGGVRKGTCFGAGVLERVRGACAGSAGGGVSLLLFRVWVFVF